MCAMITLRNKLIGCNLPRSQNALNVLIFSFTQAYAACSCKRWQQTTGLQYFSTVCLKLVCLERFFC